MNHHRERCSKEMTLQSLGSGSESRHFPCSARGSKRGSVEGCGCICTCWWGQTLALLILPRLREAGVKAPAAFPASAALFPAPDRGQPSTNLSPVYLQISAAFNGCALHTELQRNEWNACWLGFSKCFLNYPRFLRGQGQARGNFGLVF